MKTIEIVVDTKGEVTVQTKGFTGASCRQAIKFIEQALGTVQSDKATAEMYQAATAENRIEQSNG